MNFFNGNPLGRIFTSQMGGNNGSFTAAENINSRRSSRNLLASGLPPPPPNLRGGAGSSTAPRQPQPQESPKEKKLRELRADIQKVRLEISKIRTTINNLALDVQIAPSRRASLQAEKERLTVKRNQLESTARAQFTERNLPIPTELARNITKTRDQLRGCSNSLLAISVNTLNEKLSKQQTRLNQANQRKAQLETRVNALCGPESSSP